MSAFIGSYWAIPASEEKDKERVSSSSGDR